MPNRRRFDRVRRHRQASDVEDLAARAAPRRRPRSRWSAPLRRSCASTSPSASARLPTTIRSGQPSSSASVSFSPVPASRSSRGPRARPRRAPRRGARPPRRSRRPPCRAPTTWTSHGASERRPDDPLLVGALLDRRGDDARRADPVAAHHDRPLLAVVVEVGGAERLRVAGAELEDVADLDRGLDLDRVAAGDRSPGLDRADVELLEGEVAAGLDADQVRVGPVGAGEVAAALDRGVLDHGHLGADRADEPGRPELGLDLLGGRLAEVGAERVRELDLVQAVVAADQRAGPCRGRRRSPASPSAPPRRARRAPRRPPRPSSGPGSGPREARPAAGAARPAAARRTRPRRWPRSRARARPRSRPPRTGAMYSWAPEPPIIPTSDSTPYQRRPQRSKIRS